MLFGCKSLREIAGYDDVQIVHVLARRRDKWGKLVRSEELPPGVEVDDDGQRIVTRPVPFKRMYRMVKKLQGLPAEKIDTAWDEWQADNPKFGVGGV